MDKGDSIERPSPGRKRSAAKSNNQELKEAINYLQKDKTITADCRKRLKVIAFAGKDVGLTEGHIIDLMDVIEKSSVGLDTSRRIVSCLIPSGTVPIEAAITAVQIITSFNTHISLQVDLTKWLCVVYNYIGTVAHLGSLYSLLFSFIESDLMHPYICALLFQMTREHHVLSSRVETLIKYQAHVGPQPPTMALLKLYANFRPDLVTVHSKHKTMFKSLGQLYENVRKVKGDQSVARPKMENYDRKAESLYMSKKIESFKHLYTIINSLTGHVNIASFLQSPIRRELLSFCLPKSFTVRLYQFFRLSLHSECFVLFNNNDFHYQESVVLPQVALISRELHEGIPDVYSFLTSYMRIWDGVKVVKPIIELISYWEICPAGCMAPFLDLISKQLHGSTVQFMCAVLDSFTKLYKNWVLFELPRLLSRKETNLRKQRITVFARWEGKAFDPVKEIESLGWKIDAICCYAIQVHKDHFTLLLYHILSFYETVLSIHKNCKGMKLLIPAESVICAAAFSRSPAIFSQLCGLISGYKNYINILKKQNRDALVLNDILVLNCYIMDICHMLVLDCAFKANRHSTLFRERLPAALLQRIPKSMSCFHLYRHPAILSSALTFMDEMREEPIVPSLLTDPVVRKSFFLHLIKLGFGDIVTFLRGCILKFKNDA